MRLKVWWSRWGPGECPLRLWPRWLRGAACGVRVPYLLKTLSRRPRGERSRSVREGAGEPEEPWGWGCLAFEERRARVLEASE